MSYYYGDKNLRDLLGDAANAAPLSELLSEKSYKAVAYCEYTCARQAKKKKIIKESVKFSATLCPDCKNALHWKKKLLSPL